MQNPRETEAHPVSVSVAQSVVRDVDRYVEAVGRCVASSSLELSPEVTGKIVKIYHSLGAWVEENDPLFEIEDIKYAVELRQARATLDMDRARCALHQSQVERSETLVSGNFVSRQDYDTYRANLEESQARVAFDLAQVESRTVDWERCVVRAPFAGFVGLPLVEYGQIVTPQSHLTSLRQSRPLNIDFYLSEKYLLDVYTHWKNEKSLPVTISSLDHPEISDDGRLTFVDDLVGEHTLNVKLRASIDNREGHFCPGNSVKVRVNIERRPSVVMIPEEAVQISQNGPYVFVVRNGTAQMIPVTTGQSDDGWIAVESGLKAGETVVTDGHVMLFPGAPVQAAETHR
jgi:multidrug efflux system membrane fusion protein